MDMTGERRIPAPRQVVWDALNDAAVLKDCIPGCQTLEKLSDTQMKATASIKLGPISAKFSGNVELSEIDAPNSYTIGGEGQGGVAGFAKGGAKVFLTDDAAGTLLRYEVSAQVGGKIAQLGARLIDATAKQMADAFFDKFSAAAQALVPPAPEPEAVATVAPAPIVPSSLPPPSTADMTPPPSAIGIGALIPREIMGLPLAAWIGMGVFGAMALVALISAIR